ncbi:rod shape-determining protein MreD [Sphingobacterium wenxiniae]|uniref:Rod shape-determining protein MreD n=1 Tax=Sphingobacterium wenxiniae TaxID=683125 RepID=A0A1I6SUT9_9SPHI|nr:rod shape-determining protein MreD [Sphingobacterium wenxiniae]SFS80638.1 rod shape-determining protein MreD [Sphingobacterium wenxiniae]
MGKVILYNIIRFVILIVLQAALFKNMGYYNLATPFPYILFIFLLPVGLPNLLLFLICFLTGLTLDAFYDSIGVHAAACVVLGLFRISFMRVTIEVDMQNSFITPSLSEMGIKWFLTYISIGTLVHQITVSFVEIFSFTNILYTLAGTIMSSIFTILLILLLSLLIYRKKSRVSNF